jgi:hypothetical protein
VYLNYLFMNCNMFEQYFHNTHRIHWYFLTRVYITKTSIPQFLRTKLIMHAITDFFLHFFAPLATSELIPNKHSIHRASPKASFSWENSSQVILRRLASKISLHAIDDSQLTTTFFSLLFCYYILLQPDHTGNY